MSESQSEEDLAILKQIADGRYTPGANGVAQLSRLIFPLLDRVAQLEKTARVAGCICPPGSETTCQGTLCPRRVITIGPNVSTHSG